SRTLRDLRIAQKLSQQELASRSGLSRPTVAAAEGNADPRVSTLAALLDELGYALIPVPKQLLDETTRFIRNGGRLHGLEQGIEAPLSPMQTVFRRALQAQAAAASLRGNAKGVNAVAPDQDGEPDETDSL
ncbi:MAG: transcriptional regulator, family-like protein, partial [Rhizobacter sp.]|nr:transcriptional regulator, family-like protein [Rhizobacter sp.]